MSLSDISASEIESVSSADTRSVEITDARCGADMSATNPSSKHPRFFFETGFISFSVEDTLYRVHDYLFTMNSPFWAQKLDAPRNDTIITRLDVTRADMDAFLAILYNRNFQGHDLTSYQEWESALRLATRWEFNSIRALAIDMLEPLASPLQKLVLARSFDVPQWLQSALVSLCMRKEPLALSEADLLSMSDVVAIATARETLRDFHLKVPSENEVSAYVANVILSPRLPPPSATESMDLSAPAIPPELSLPLEQLDGTMEPIPHSRVLPAKPSPSSEDILCLVSFLMQRNYHAALDMVTEDNAHLFASILSDNTTIWKSTGTARDLVIAIFHRGTVHTAFASAGVKLLTVLPPITRDGTLQAILREQAQMYTAVARAVDNAKRQYPCSDFAHVVQYCATAGGSDHAEFFAILRSAGSNDLSENLYEERMANLYAFFNRITDAQLLSTTYVP